MRSNNLIHKSGKWIKDLGTDLEKSGEKPRLIFPDWWIPLFFAFILEIF